jgi:hypothetical protein
MSTILTKLQREVLESVSMEIGEFVVRSRHKRMGRLDIGTETLEFLVSLAFSKGGLRSRIMVNSDTRSQMMACAVCMA